jgi:hypothetical protein
VEVVGGERFRTQVKHRKASASGKSASSDESPIFIGDGRRSDDGTVSIVCCSSPWRSVGLPHLGDPYNERRKGERPTEVGALRDHKALVMRTLTECPSACGEEWRRRSTNGVTFLMAACFSRIPWYSHGPSAKWHGTYCPPAKRAGPMTRCTDGKSHSGDGGTFCAIALTFGQDRTRSQPGRRQGS